MMRALPFLVGFFSLLFSQAANCEEVKEDLQIANESAEAACPSSFYLDDCNFCPPQMHVLQFGANYTYACFEPGNGPRFSGSLGGVQALYEYRSSCHFYAGLKVNWRSGKTEGSEGSVKEERALNYVDVQERFGYSFYLCCCKLNVTPFCGIGFHHLKHRLDSSACPRTLNFYYNEFYVPVGLRTNYFCNSCLAVGLNFVWMPQFYPTVAIYPLGGARWILEETYDNFSIEVPVTIRINSCKALTFVFKPFYERWSDGRAIAKKSDGTRLNLPGIDYHFWGFDLNLAYFF